MTKCRHSKGGCVDLVLWILPKCRKGGGKGVQNPENYVDVKYGPFHNSQACEYLGWMILLTFCFCCAVVSQPYVTETHNTYVIKGNSALFKCEIPSFVADFVSAEGWVDGDGQEFFAQSGHGNFRRPAHTLVAVKRTPNHCASFMNLSCPG